MELPANDGAAVRAWDDMLSIEDGVREDMKAELVHDAMPDDRGEANSPNADAARGERGLCDNTSDLPGCTSDLEGDSPHAQRVAALA